MISDRTTERLLSVRTLLLLISFGVATVATGVVNADSVEPPVEEVAPSTAQHNSQHLGRSMTMMVANTRNKRGISDFFQRFWKGGRKPQHQHNHNNHHHHNSQQANFVNPGTNFQAQQSHPMASFSQADYPFQSSEMYPMFAYQGQGQGPNQHQLQFQQQQQFQPQFNPNFQSQLQSQQSEQPSDGSQANFAYPSFNNNPAQQQQFAQQMAAAYQQQQQSQYNQYQPNQEQQQQQQQQGPNQYQPSGDNYQSNDNGPQQQGPGSDSQNYQTNNGGGGGGGNGGMQGEESYNQPISYRPGNQMAMMASQGSAQYAPISQAQANTFQAKPYGPQASAIDVHQVLDQFIRSAGLSPSGDHDAVKGERSFQESHTKPVFSLKKLYSYPFYFTASGEKSGNGYNNIRRSSNDELLINAALKKNLLASQKMDSQPLEPLSPSPSSSSSSGLIPLVRSKLEPEDVGEDETLFIAKNAQALQEFLTSSQQHQSQQQQQNDKTDNKISGTKSLEQ